MTALTCAQSNLLRSQKRTYIPWAVAAVILGNLAQSAFAESRDTKLEEIVVSGSRLARPDVPTPLLSISVDVLQEVPRANIVAALNDLPQFKATYAAQTTSGQFAPGVFSVDLRGLGPVRTLALLDGRRLVGAYANGTDLSILPSSLISRVDIVTGGASAAWGSNAVAGVVNFVIDSKLEGIRLGVRGGTSSRSDVDERALESVFGTGFGNDRGHFIIGAEYVDNKGGGPRTDREMVGRWAVINGTLTPDVGDRRYGSGGLILTGVNAGMAFNPDSTLRTYNRGTIVGNNTVGGENLSSPDDIGRFYPPTERYGALARMTYDLTETIKITADLLHARSRGNYPIASNQNAGDITITQDNAFLPAAIRTQMVAAGETSFTMGRFNEDYAVINNDNSRTTTQATLQVDGSIGELAWQGYYTRGNYDQDTDFTGQRILGNFALAVDAVINPATGSPVCRASLANSAINCVPINLFGVGAPSQAARDYVTGTGIQRVTNELDAGGLSVRGEPIELWAGAVSMALGVEARRESADNDNGPIDRLSGFTLSNFPKYGGRNTTKEAFGEIQLPVIRDVPLLKLFQVNGAGRIIDDQSGSISAWKLGFINEVATGVQVRFTRSRDIRSPNIDELFSTRLGPRIARVIDPNTNSNVQVFEFVGGNPALGPEQALTTTAGITITPPSFPGLNFSVDYFDINVEDAIASLSAQNVIDGCFRGNQELCAAIVRDSNGDIVTVDAALQNFQSFRTSGFDFALGYTLPISAASSLGVRSNWSWLREFEQDTGLTTIDYLGTQGFQTGSRLGVPRLKGTTSLFYQSANFEANIRGRYISSGKHNKAINITNNDIPTYVYADLGLQFTLPRNDGSSIEFFGNVANALDKDPPPGTQVNANYDIVGRYYTAGAKMRF